MTGVTELVADERRRWTIAGSVALAAHVAVLASVLAGVQQNETQVPEPVVLVELPPEGASAPAPMAAQQIAQPQPEYVPPRVVTPPIDVPEVRAPLPQERVSLPPPPRLPMRASSAVATASPAPATNALAVTPTGKGSGSSQVTGSDPKAKAQEADYFALVSAHLNRKKRYPAEAKKAMQQGIVTVRFTVARDGTVSATSIKRSSGHELLDAATLDLVRRVSPLPRMPASMNRDSVTLSLPIEYSLKTN